MLEQKFGCERYAIYTEKLNKEESMDIFCDIYSELMCSTSENLNRDLRELLISVQTSIRISRNFFYISLGYVVAMLMLIGLDMIPAVFFAAAGAVSLCYLYKLVEFIRNRYCDKDVRIVLIYKIVLFHILEENMNQSRQKQIL